MPVVLLPAALALSTRRGSEPRAGFRQSAGHRSSRAELAWDRCECRFAPAVATRCAARFVLVGCGLGSTRPQGPARGDRKSTRLNSSHGSISYAVFFLEKKKEEWGRAEVRIMEQEMGDGVDIGER